MEGVERSDVDAFLKAYRERHAIETASDGKARLVAGKQPWTFRIPMAKATTGRRFDTRAPAEEIRVRRICRNGLAAVQRRSRTTSFMISHEGQVFEKNLGPTVESQTRSMERLDPDDSWSIVP